MRTRRSRHALTLSLIIGSALLFSSASAQDRPLKKIYWGQTSIGASQWIPWIAKDARLYEKHGLD
ncbi:MAG TPA: hypothetical protein VF353_01490, partial [Candidatus Binatia bacterium]